MGPRTRKASRAAVRFKRHLAGSDRDHQGALFPDIDHDRAGRLRVHHPRLQRAWCSAFIIIVMTFWRLFLLHERGDRYTKPEGNEQDERPAAVAGHGG